MPEPQFKKIVIFGVGLIGGSFALALRKAHAGGKVVVLGRSWATLQYAMQLSILGCFVNDATKKLHSWP